MIKNRIINIIVKCIIILGIIVLVTSNVLFVNAMPVVLKETNVKNKVPDNYITYSSAFEDESFDYLSSIKKLFVPAKETEIYSTGENDYLWGCNSLKKIKVEDGHPFLKVIHGALVDTKTKTLLECPRKLKKGKFIVPKNVKRIGNYSLNNDYFTKIIIGEKVENLGRYSVKGKRLKTVVIKAKNTVVDECAFAGNKSLEHVALGQKTKFISLAAFKECTSLEKIVFPKSVKWIGWESFAGCKKLKCVKIKSRVKKIYKGAFKGCDSLKKVVVPKTAKVEEGAFPNTCRVIRK